MNKLMILEIDILQERKVWSTKFKILSGIFNLDFNFEELLPFEKLNKMYYGFISNSNKPLSLILKPIEDRWIHLLCKSHSFVLSYS